MKTINDIYTYNKEANTPMLSDYSATWWADYVTNYDKYDKVFRRLYYSFLYFMQSTEETIAEISGNFSDDVENLLMIHAKEFDELWRVHVQANDAYNLVDNYSMTETMDRDTSDTLGQRQDSYTNNTGAQTNGTTGKQAPYDSENFYNDTNVETSVGAREDGGTATTGSQSNSGTEDYTLTRSGNIGVSTATDIMQKHVNFWSSFNFYHYVFGVIARELLTSGD